MRRQENDPELTDRLQAWDNQYALVHRLVTNGELSALDVLIDNMRLAMDRVQFRLNDLRFRDSGIKPR